MKRKTSVFDDPVVEEVRRIRAKLWAEAGGTVEGYLRLMDERAELRKKAAANKGKSANGRRNGAAARRTRNK